MNRQDIDDTIRDMWATRPRRRRGDKKVAGVAAAFARRYQIDPTLVRIALIVLTVWGGVGLVIYLAGWLLMPQDDRPSIAEAAFGRHGGSNHKPHAVLLTIALLMATVHVLSHLPGSLLAVASSGMALFLLHRHRGHLGVPAEAGQFRPVDAPPAYAAAGYAAPPGGPYPSSPYPYPAYQSAGPAPTIPDVGGRPTDQVPTAPHAEPRQTPPAWDPLGVAPFAWDLPEPAAAEPPPPPATPRRRSKVTPVTIALALVTAGIGSLAASYDSYLDGPKVVAMVLAVIGCGMLVGSFVRGGRGLIALAIPMAAITWGLATVPSFDVGSIGNRQYTPTTVADIAPVYEHGMGNLELDLRQVDLPDTTVKHIDVFLTFGNLQVRVPENVDVEATCTSERGNVDCLGATANGLGSTQTVNDPGSDGEGGGRLVLQLKTTGGGNVELERG